MKAQHAITTEMSDNDDFFDSLMGLGESASQGTATSRGTRASSQASTAQSMPSTTGRRSRTNTSHSARNYPVDRWVFTAYDVNWARGLPLDQLPPGVDYICGQPELCPSTQRPHLQGFVIFAPGANIRTAEQALAKLGIVNGWADKAGTQTCKKAIDYTKKAASAVLDADGNSQWKELGAVPANQRKVGETMEQIIEIGKSGGKFSDVLQANPSIAVRCHSGVVKALSTLQPDRPHNVPLKVYIIWGSTGLGKSHAIFKFLSDPDTVYNKLHPTNQQATDFWEGYDGQTEVLFDDFNPVQYSVRQLLHYFHEWPGRVQIKGGNAKMQYHTVYITSNVAPNMWYLSEKTDPHHKGNYEALWRRIPEKNVCRFVTRVPDNVQIQTFEELKAFQDAECAAKGLSVMGSTAEEAEMRAKLETHVKRKDRAVLERIAVEMMLDAWKAAPSGAVAGLQ